MLLASPPAWSGLLALGALIGCASAHGSTLGAPAEAAAVDPALLDRCLALSADSLVGRPAGADACSALAETLPPRSPVAWNLHVRGCDAGDAEACVRVTEGMAGVEPYESVDESLVAYPRACELGSLVGCHAWRTLVDEVLPGSDVARMALRDGCIAGEEAWCAELEAGGLRSALVKDVRWISSNRQRRSDLPKALAFSPDSGTLLLGGDPWIAVDMATGKQEQGPPMFEMEPVSEFLGPTVAGLATADGGLRALLRDRHLETSVELGGSGEPKPVEWALWDVRAPALERLDARLAAFSPDGRAMATWTPGVLTVRLLEGGPMRTTRVRGDFSALGWTADQIVLAGSQERRAFDASLHAARPRSEVPWPRPERPEVNAVGPTSSPGREGLRLNPHPGDPPGETRPVISPVAVRAADGLRATVDPAGLHFTTAGGTRSWTVTAGFSDPQLGSVPRSMAFSPDGHWFAVVTRAPLDPVAIFELEPPTRTGSGGSPVADPTLQGASGAWLTTFRPIPDVYFGPPDRAAIVRVAGDPDAAGILRGDEEWARMAYFAPRDAAWRLGAGHWDVYAEFPGRCVEVQPIDVSLGQRVTLSFPESTRIVTGRVVDPSGVPLVARSVKAMCEADGAATVRIRGEVDVKTDRGGRFTLRGLAPGAHTLTVWVSGYGTMPVPITAEEGTVDLGDLVMVGRRDTEDWQVGVNGLPGDAEIAAARNVEARAAEPRTRADVVSLFASEPCIPGQLSVTEPDIHAWILSDTVCDDLEYIRCGSRTYSSGYLLRQGTVVGKSHWEGVWGQPPESDPALFEAFRACRAREREAFAPPPR